MPASVLQRILPALVLPNVLLSACATAPTPVRSDSVPVAAERPAPAAPGAPASQDVPGRWDITITTPDGPRPSWLEVRKSGHRSLVGQFVGIVGSARPIAEVHVAGDSLHFSIPRQWEEGTSEVQLRGRVAGERMSGMLTFGDGRWHRWTGSRAPVLHRQAEPQWGAPVALFTGTDLSGWRVFGGENQWRAENGILRNVASGGNLATERTFDDFKLHLEFRYPDGSNSGVYLRGRYEVQIADSMNVQPAADLLGAVYGFIVPSELVARAPGEWQTYDITLVGRMVTVVANGKTIICDREIPGITGGALDSNEGAPGPIFLQGDHGPIEYRNIVITPAR